MSWSEVKKINSNLDVPLNEIEPVGVQLPFVSKQVLSTTLVYSATATSTDLEKTIFSLSNDNGGRLYEINRLAFVFSGVITNSAGLFMEVDGKEYNIANFDRTSKINGMEVSSASINILDINNTQDSAFYNSGLKHTILSNYGGYEFNFEQKPLLSQPMGSNIGISTSPSVNYLFNINKYIPFKKNLRLFLRYNLKQTNSSYPDTIKTYTTWYYAYTLND